LSMVKKYRFYYRSQKPFGQTQRGANTDADAALRAIPSAV
jgi:hypothetical protein